MSFEQLLNITAILKINKLIFFMLNFLFANLQLLFIINKKVDSYFLYLTFSKKIIFNGNSRYSYKRTNDNKTKCF